ncbi:hypothetical protein PsYK624_140750 [Phanerochaete sordida]|uniref:Fungal-type protein kinase domain-containing protein n=1 Tax=Phanerochaete sordida TaxID=48140 RepID=A0A9P3GMV6_9APHY|nr:hypothetical protein PsYK624_140750 [Phanerochaete sordida]
MSQKYSFVQFGDFMKTFVPGRNMSAEQLRSVGDLSELFKLNFRKDKESSMYPIFCKKFNIIQEQAQSADRWKDVADWHESTDIDIRTDIALYPTTKAARDAYVMPVAESVTPERKPFVARSAWAWMKMFLECKPSEAESGYSFTGEFVQESTNGPAARAQNVKYASEIMLRQHREFLFSLYATQSHVAIFRWDRNGAVYTKIDLRKDAKNLFNFVYRFARLASARQGFDPTVGLASKSDIDKWRAYTSSNSTLMKLRDGVFEDIVHFPVYKMQCERLPAEETEEEQPSGRRRTRKPKKVPPKVYLVGRHATGDCVPTGRCTRTYVAYDLEEDKLVYIKDSWRSKKNLHAEADTYLRLKKHGVQHVATLLAGGDVGGSASPQHTVSQEYQPDGPHKDFERAHHRVVFKEIGRPLDGYPNSGELIILVSHAAIGHYEAWTKAGVLHRDVSLSNMLIDVESPRKRLRCFLTDWDLCRYLEDYHQDLPSSPARSGTWPYLSALALAYPKKPQDLSDDLEAFVNVIVGLALRFHPHKLSLNYAPDISGDALRLANKGNTGLAQHIFNFFYQDCLCEGGYWSGGDMKLLTILTRGKLPVYLKPGANGPTPLARLIDDLYALLRLHYETIDFDDMKRYEVAVSGDQNALSLLENGAGEDAQDDSDDSDSDVDATARVSFPWQDPVEDEVFGTEPVHIEWPKGKPRPLDTHGRFLKIFERAITGHYGPILKICRGDKTPDQLDGLLNLEEAADKKSSSSKRSRDSFADDGLGLEFQEIYSKRVRLDPGFYMPLDPIPEDPEEDTANARSAQTGAEGSGAPAEADAEVLPVTTNGEGVAQPEGSKKSRARATRGRGKPAVSVPTRRSTRTKTERKT